MHRMDLSGATETAELEGAQDRRTSKPGDSTAKTASPHYYRKYCAVEIDAWRVIDGEPRQVPVKSRCDKRQVAGIRRSSKAAVFPSITGPKPGAKLRTPRSASERESVRFPHGSRASDRICQPRQRNGGITPLAHHYPNRSLKSDRPDVLSVLPIGG